MRKKNFFLILFIIFCNVAILFSTDIFYDTTYNTSATNYAFGYYSGGSNIWNNNPLDVWSNPAKLGYYTGIAYGYAYYPWLEKVLDDYNFQYSYLSFGYRGIGISLPLNGTKYYLDKITDENGENIGQSVEKIKNYSLGINLLQFSKNFIKTKGLIKLNKKIDFSLGYSYMDINTPVFKISPDNFYTDDLGIILRISPMNENRNIFNLHLVTSMNWLNLTKKKFEYALIDTITNVLRVASGRQFETSARIEIKSDILRNVLSQENFKILSYFTDNVFSFYCIYNYSIINNYESKAVASEFTFFDIFSFRLGYFNESGSEIKNITTGLGLNLNFRNFIKLQYNTSSIPVVAFADIQDRQTVNDWMINIDFLRILGFDK